MSSTTPNLGLVKATGAENYNVAIVNANLDKIDADVAAKADASRVFLLTLSAGAWVGSAAPYTQTVAVTGLPADAKGKIGLYQESDAEFLAAQDAAVRPVNPNPAGNVTFKALGTKPTIDLPCAALVVG